MPTVDEPPRFAHELRAWRVRRGRSQLELSIDAGTTQRHLSYLEQGRSRPSRTMVVRLAESLQLSLRDRNALLLSGGYAPLFPESDLDSTELRPVRQALATNLDGHDPYPVVVVRPDGEIVAANRAIDVLTEGADPELVKPPMNAVGSPSIPGAWRPGSGTSPSGPITSSTRCAPRSSAARARTSTAYCSR